MANAPPLHIWLYSVLLAAGVLALLILARNIPGARYDNTIAGQTQTFLSTPSLDGKKRVLGFGSSLLWAATSPTSGEQQAPLHNIAWMRMTKGGPGMGYLQAGLDMVNKHPPDVLVIEGNLLLPGDENMFMDQLREDLWHLSKQTVSFFTARRFPPPPSYWERNDQERAFPCISNMLGVTEPQIRQHIEELQNLYQHAQFDTALISNLAILAQRGVHIVLLDIPRSQRIEQQTAPQKQQWVRNLQKILPPSNNIIYLVSPTLSQPDDYCDASHLNSKGARLFASWWQAQLQKEC